MNYRCLLFIILLFSCKKHGAGTMAIYQVNTNQSITLINNTDSTVDLKNWKLEEVYGFEVLRKNEYNLPPILLNKGGTQVYTAAALGFILNKAYTTVYLYDPGGNKISELSGNKFK